MPLGPSLAHRRPPAVWNEDSPDPEPSPAGLFGGHHVRKWLPAKHRRPQARGAMPGPVRRNACKMLVQSSARLSRTVVREETGASVLQAFLSSTLATRLTGG